MPYFTLGVLCESALVQMIRWQFHHHMQQSPILFTVNQDAPPTYFCPECIPNSDFDAKSTLQHASESSSFETLEA